MEPTFSHVMSLLRRFSLPIALILISTAAVLLYLPDMEMPDSVRPFGSKFIVLALLAYALIILLFNYLQGSSAWHRSDEAPIQELMWEVRRLRDLAVHTTVPTPIPDELQKLISELKEQRVSSLQLETTEKKDLVEGLRAAVSKTLSEEFLRSIDDHYSAAAFR